MLKLQTIGPYRVLAKLGEGGMGEVYRARDPRLGRDVAIKVLHAAVAHPEAAARFEREGRALAALSHPHIATIYGLEEVALPGQPPTTALVLELVEGETLADRLAGGPIPASEALRIASQIADALSAAHDTGIIHRDLKPSNVGLTPAGAVKVLDFGLARIAEEGLDRSTVTLTATAGNVVLGTPAYMAPEQAQGLPVDKRADIWAFGVLLYEMLAGRRPFSGRSFHEILDAARRVEPDWGPIPPNIRTVLRRCLAPDPRNRLRDIGDFQLLLDELSAASGAPEPRHPARAPAVLAFMAGVAILAVAGAWFWTRDTPERASAVVRLRTMLPAGVLVTRGPGFASSVALSPDGRTLVVAGTGGDGQRLYRQELDRFEAEPIAGTHRGSSPFFSPDGAWIGFFADGAIRRVPTAGGAPVEIVPATPFVMGAGWGADDRIVFSTAGRLKSVHVGGGDVRQLETGGAGVRPELLPGRRTVLFEASDGWIRALDLETGALTQIVRGRAPRYVEGYLVLASGSTLLAAPFDPKTLALNGPLVPVVEGVRTESPVAAGASHYAISAAGTLAYIPATERYELVLVDPDGTTRRLGDEQPSFQNPRFSPDGKRIVVAATRRPGGPPDLWVYDLGTGTGTRLTFDGGRAPVWTRDGTSVTYSRPGAPAAIHQKRADGQGESALMHREPAFHWLAGWSPEGALAYGRIEAAGSVILSLKNGQAREVVPTGDIWGGRLSQDGRWLAYYTRESGTFEVYVTPFPEGGARWLIADGTDPGWSPDGAELYYRSGARLMAARLDTSAGVRVRSHRIAVEPFLPPLYDDFDIHPNRRTLVLVRPAAGMPEAELRLTLAWFTELRRLVPRP